MDLRYTGSLQQFFRDIPLFAALDGEELGEIVRLSQPFTRKIGEQIFAEGDPASGMYVVERGEMAVMSSRPNGDPITLAVLGNGAVIGEMALIDGGKRSASVEAVAQTNGFWISRSDFNGLREARSVAAYKIILSVARTLEERRRVTEMRVQKLVVDPDRAEKLKSPAVREILGRFAKA